VHGRDIDAMTPGDLREIQPKDIVIGDLPVRRIEGDFALDGHACPAIAAGGEDSRIVRLRKELLPRRFVPLAGLVADRDTQVGEGHEGHAAADEHGNLERGREAVDGVREEEGGCDAAALGEGHDAVVGTIAVEEVEQPSVGGGVGGGGGAGDEGMVGRWVEEVYACGGGGGVGAVDEVEGRGRAKVEFCAEGGW